MRRLQRAWRFYGELLFGLVVTHVPVRHLRLGYLRMLGARIGRDAAIFRGTTVLGVEHLEVGNGTNIGFRCVLDARGGLTIGDHVVVASDTVFVTASHDIDSDDFHADLSPTVVEDHVWLATRVSVGPGVTIGRGAVVGMCSLVRSDLPPMTVAVGVPARHLRFRTSDLSYEPAWHPRGY